MKILLVNNGTIPVSNYGGTERMIWYLGKELAKMGHQVIYLVEPGSRCDFARVLFIDKTKRLEDQIPDSVDVVQFYKAPVYPVSKPYVVRMNGNMNHQVKLDRNTFFLSKNHAARFQSDVFVHNGLDWSDYGKPDLNNQRDYFHFLGKAAWRVKNVKGAIDIIEKTQKERLAVLGGSRFNINMGFRFTTSLRTRFYGMVGGERKNQLLNGSKGLIFPVLWHEPFGIAVIESLYFGCPVFATPYGSLPEIVGPDFGFLSNKASELAAAVENNAAYSRTNCHAYAVEQFNSKKMAASYLALYEKVLNGNTLNERPPQINEVQTERFLHWG